MVIAIQFFFSLLLHLITWYKDNYWGSLRNTKKSLFYLVCQYQYFFLIGVNVLKIDTLLSFQVSIIGMHHVQIRDSQLKNETLLLEQEQKLLYATSSKMTMEKENLKVNQHLGLSPGTQEVYLLHCDISRASFWCYLDDIVQVVKSLPSFLSPRIGYLGNPE